MNGDFDTGAARKEEHLTQPSPSDGPISDVVPLWDVTQRQDGWTGWQLRRLNHNCTVIWTPARFAVTENRRLPSGTRFKETDKGHVN